VASWSRALLYFGDFKSPILPPAVPAQINGTNLGSIVLQARRFLSRQSNSSQAARLALRRSSTGSNSDGSGRLV
jgi:hypothetical protein